MSENARGSVRPGGGTLCEERGVQRIVFLDQYAQFGGGQQVLLELADAARSENLAVTALLPEGPCADRMAADGMDVRHIPWRAFTQGEKTLADMLRLAAYNIRVFLQNLRLLRSADLIYVNGNRLLPAAMLAQRLFGTAAACHIHLNHGALEKTLFRIFLKHRATAAIVVPSAFIQRELTGFDAVFGSSRVRLVENGLDARFSDAAFEDRITGRPLRQVGVVGRISPEKGQDVLPALARHFPDMEFHVLGDAAFSSGDFYAALRRESPANVHFHGWVEDLPEKVRKIGLQCCLVPSRCPKASGQSFEAAPLVPLQMAALSCLVLVRRLGALREVAERLRLPTFDADDDLVPLLERLRARSPEENLGLCRNTHATVRARYDYRSFHEHLRGLMRGLLCGERGAWR